MELNRTQSQDGRIVLHAIIVVMEDDDGFYLKGREAI